MWSPPNTAYRSAVVWCDLQQTLLTGLLPCDVISTCDARSRAAPGHRKWCPDTAQGIKSLNNLIISRVLSLILFCQIFLFNTIQFLVKDWIVEHLIELIRIFPGLNGRLSACRPRQETAPGARKVSSMYLDTTGYTALYTMLRPRNKCPSAGDTVGNTRWISRLPAPAVYQTSI